MEIRKDVRAGYRVPDGYFEEFSARMATMVAKQQPVRRPMWKPLFLTAASVAAVLVLAFGIFNFFPKTGDDIISELPLEEIFVGYFGATESEVVDYYLVDDSQPESISDEDVLEYLSNSGMVNLYALMDY